MRFQRHRGRKLAAIYLGGIAGALIRVGPAEAFPHDAGSWLWPTFAVNILGAFAVGYFFASSAITNPSGSTIL
jgi:CrcB protein